jgi:hypothetical protein
VALEDRQAMVKQRAVTVVERQEEGRVLGPLIPAENAVQVINRERLSDLEQSDDLLLESPLIVDAVIAEHEQVASVAAVDEPWQWAGSKDPVEVHRARPSMP